MHGSGWCGCPRRLQWLEQILNTIMDSQTVLISYLAIVADCFLQVSQHFNAILWAILSDAVINNALVEPQLS